MYKSRFEQIYKQKIIKPDVLKETIKKIFSSDDSWNYIFKETKISISHLQDLKN